MVEHYFSKTQESAFKPKKVQIRVAGIEFELYTAGGTFSPERLDIGTRLLIESAITEEGWTVLDFGCGYGVLGIALKIMYPTINVVFSDVNERAVKLTEMNCRLNNIIAGVYESDGFKNEKLAKLQFNNILINPPQTAGKDTCFRMIEEAKEHLAAGGMLQLVARHQKGGKSLSKHMEEVFGNVRDSSKSAGYRVYVSEKE